MTDEPGMGDVLRRVLNTKDAEIARLTAENAELRKDAERLTPHAKWLRQCAVEIASAGHYGWGNTCTAAADAIDAARSKR